MVVRVRVQPSPFNGGEQGRRLKRIDRCDIERRILTGGRWMGRFRTSSKPTLFASLRLYFSSLIDSSIIYSFLSRDNNRNRVKTIEIRKERITLTNRDLSRENLEIEFIEVNSFFRVKKEAISDSFAVDRG